MGDNISENTVAPSARELALHVLGEVFRRSRKPKDALDDVSSGLDRRDRAFLMELVYGVLRYRDYLDWMLGGFLREPAGLPPDTRNNLRIAVYQAHFMRVPEWAAVNEAVDIEKAHRGKASLVNAVLRSFLRNKEGISLPSPDNAVDYLSISTSHPGWLVKRWIKRFGYDEASRLLRKNNEIPPLVIRAGAGREREEALQALRGHGVAAGPTAFSPAGIIIEGSHFFQEIAEIMSGHAVAQDEASQLVAYLLNPAPGERVLDACASPGGKATHIAAMMQDRGEVVAVEIEKKKIGRLEQNVSRLGLGSVRIVNADVKRLDEAGYCLQQPGRCIFDRILLDAPCSALGVIRRNPDLKYRHGRKDLARLREGQLGMLRSASRFLKPGGVMVYSVCSTEPEEGEEVIRGFLQDRRDFSIIEGDYEFLRPFETRESGHVFYRMFPHRHDMDGFFAARLKKG